MNSLFYHYWQRRGRVPREESVNIYHHKAITTAQSNSNKTFLKVLNRSGIQHNVSAIVKYLVWD